ncbi:phage portal protein [Gordonibacter massiliensis (ex Traore et al. 2017)]|uniref:phage portal protein n=1 Tax=Gordonibacter massiliensis (ex Traore et al. 2017) TaxID=1841863 RepID=UPI001C8B1A6A|nr:phage portal protein [Gordonibacter massiliensis (ex Traore et al. 2017)]MBX9032664.1 phage portal protein [Gordonibacter massiliensis (ex Traore et al. 2017)]
MANFLTRHFNFLSNRIVDAEFEAAFDSLSDRVAFKNLALHIATTYISNAIAGCEIKVYDKGEEVKNDLYYRLNVSPNPNQTGTELVDYIVQRMCYDGSALAVPYRSKYIYAAESFSPDRVPMKEHLFKGIVIDGQAIKREYKASDVFHFKLNDRNVKSFVDSLYTDYGKLIGAAIDGFRATRGRKYKLVLDNVRVGDDKFAKEYNDVVKEQLDAFMNSPNAIYPQFKGYDLQEMKHETAGDASDIIAMRKEIFDCAAQAFKIPNSMMYGNMTNTGEVVNQFLTFAVDPIASVLNDEFTRKSYTYGEWLGDSKVVVDTKRINHVDIFNVANGIDKLISSGAFSIDMVLANLGYQPLNTEFSKAHFITKNYSLAEDAMNRLNEGGENDNGKQ